jgi:glycosyltransferase involved in cell wall biosynthesis
MRPKVSVIIPTYNRADKVGKTIESALAQTFTDLEVIVVDDGSSDDTGNVLARAYGNRIRYFLQENQGASVARNRGVEEARGDWIAFLDSDDLWEKDKIEWQLRAIDQFAGRCGACYTDTRFYNNPETRTLFQLAADNYRHTGEMGVNEEVPRLVVKPGGAGMVVCLSSLLARADLVRDSGGFDPKLLYSQDSEFLFRLALRTQFCYVNRPLVLFDRSPAELRHVGVSANWNRMEFWLQDSQMRLEGLLRLIETKPENASSGIRAVIRERLREVHSGWANWYLESGEYGKARSAAWQAVRTDLTFKVAAKWLLTWVSPRLALRGVHYNQERRRDSVPTV